MLKYISGGSGHTLLHWQNKSKKEDDGIYTIRYIFLDEDGNPWKPVYESNTFSKFKETSPDNIEWTTDYIYTSMTNGSSGTAGVLFFSVTGTPVVTPIASSSLRAVTTSHYIYEGETGAFPSTWIPANDTDYKTFTLKPETPLEGDLQYNAYGSTNSATSPIYFTFYRDYAWKEGSEYTYGYQYRINTRFSAGAPEIDGNTITYTYKMIYRTETDNREATT